MKENYSAMCENILNNLNDKKKLLLHSCCGPCSSYVISSLTKYFDITILYYNPNIFSYNDYYNECIKGLEMEPERGNRCKVCYYLRMEKTAILAKENNYDFFCTTLS